MLKKTTPIVVSVALSLGASTALAGQAMVPQKEKMSPAATAQKVSPALKDTGKVTAAQKPQAVKASKKIQLTKDRVIIQRKGPGHVA